MTCLSSITTDTSNDERGTEGPPSFAIQALFFNRSVFDFASGLSVDLSERIQNQVATALYADGRFLAKVALAVGCKPFGTE